MRSRFLVFLVVVFAVAAAVTCHYLVLKHVSGTSGESWFEAGCVARPGSTVNCAAVLQSPYSVFPPKHPNEAPGRGHIPVALVGLMYYTALAIWFVGVGVPSRSRAWLHLIPTLFVGFGLATSGLFLWIMYRQLEAWCPWCLLTHAINFLIAGCVVLMWPLVMQRPAQAEPTQPHTQMVSTGVAIPTPLRRPAGRVVLMTMIAMVAANFAHLSSLGMRTYRRAAESRKTDFDSCVGQLNVFKADPIVLLTQWQRTPANQVERRPDDPVRTYSDQAFERPPLDVVVFSDFECPSCQRFASFFESQVPAMFGGRVCVTFKHYPIDQTCNPRAGATLHPNACQAAKMAEAARVLGGNAAFWRAHDFLFNHRDELATGRMTAERVASEIGLDLKALVETMASTQISERLAADAAQAGQLGVTGTPAVFVDSRPLTPTSKVVPGFWDAVAQTYWERIGIARPEATKPREPAKQAAHPATQDSP